MGYDGRQGMHGWMVVWNAGSVQLLLVAWTSEQILVRKKLFHSAPSRGGLGISMVCSISGPTRSSGAE